MIHQVGALRRPAGLLSVSWTVTGSIKIKQDTTLEQDIVTIPVADWPALRKAIDAAIEARQNTQGADAVSEAQSLTTKLDAHADWLDHVKDMPKNAELIRDAAQEIRHLRLTLVRIIGGVAHATWPGRAEQLASSALRLSETHIEAVRQIEQIKNECER